MESLAMQNVPLKNAIVSAEPEFNPETGFLDGIRFRLREPSKDTIYLLSTGEVVRDFPEWLFKEGFVVSMQDIPFFLGAITKNISRYAHSVSSRDDLVVDLSVGERRKLTLIASKHFTRMENTNIGRYKLTMKFLVEDPDFGTYEDISINFTKRDIYTLFYMTQKILAAQQRSKTFFVLAKRLNEETGEEIDEIHIPIAKIYDSFVIGEVWLHGQELLNLFYLTDQLTHNFFSIEHLMNYAFTYRQIEAVEEDGIMYLYVSKMDEHSEKVIMRTKDDIPFIYKIPVSSMLLAILNATGSVDMLSHIENSHLESETSNPFRSIEGLKYHISMKESFFGVGIAKGKLFLAGKVKEGEHVDKAISQDIVILDSFIIKLRQEFVIKLIKAASIAYNGNLSEWDRDLNLVKFYVKTSDMQGNIRYEFSLTTDVKNKVPLVLKIDKYRDFGKDKKELLASFRQPFFHRYIFQLISMLLITIKELPQWEYSKEFSRSDLLAYKYSSLKKVKKLVRSAKVKVGFKRDEDENVYEGILESKNKMGMELERLDRSDINMLNISSRHRILHGEWIFFVGEKVAIGPDKYFTDLYSEFNLEEEMGSGESWAAGIFGATK